MLATSLQRTRPFASSSRRRSAVEAPARASSRAMPHSAAARTMSRTNRVDMSIGAAKDTWDGGGAALLRSVRGRGDPIVEGHPKDVAVLVARDVAREASGELPALGAPVGLERESVGI